MENCLVVADTRNALPRSHKYGTKHGIYVRDDVIEYNLIGFSTLTKDRVARRSRQTLLVLDQDCDPNSVRRFYCIYCNNHIDRTTINVVRTP